MFCILSKVDTEPVTGGPAATGRTALNRANGTVNEGIEHLVIDRHNSSVRVGQHGCEVERVGGDTGPCQVVGS